MQLSSAVYACVTCVVVCQCIYVMYSSVCVCVCLPVMACIVVFINVHLLDLLRKTKFQTFTRGHFEVSHFHHCKYPLYIIVWFSFITIWLSFEFISNTHCRHVATTCMSWTGVASIFDCIVSDYVVNARDNLPSGSI